MLTTRAKLASIHDSLECHTVGGLEQIAASLDREPVDPDLIIEHLNAKQAVRRLLDLTAAVQHVAMQAPPQGESALQWILDTVLLMGDDFDPKVAHALAYGLVVVAVRSPVLRHRRGLAVTMLMRVSGLTPAVRSRSPRG